MFDVPLRSPYAEPSLMGMPHAAERWTADRVRALPDDGNRYELISGQLVVTPAPRGLHQIAVRELAFLLDRWLSPTRRAALLWSPADISLGDDEVLQPDLFVYPIDARRAVREWTDITTLLLVIEVTSPSTARHDRTLKRRRYQRAGIPEYWIVDLDARLIERWRPADSRPEILSEHLAWRIDAEGPELSIDLVALFAMIYGEG